MNWQISYVFFVLITKNDIVLSRHRCHRSLSDWISIEHWTILLRVCVFHFVFVSWLLVFVFNFLRVYCSFSQVDRKIFWLKISSVCVIVHVWLLLLVSASKFHVMASTLEQFGLYLDEEKCVFDLVRDGQFATSWLFNFYLKPENSQQKKLIEQENEVEYLPKVLQCKMC